MLTIEKISNLVSTVAEEFGIKRILLFGSYADGKNTPESDVDLLIEFYTDTVSLITLTSLKYRLEELLNVNVDIIHAPLEEGAMIIPERQVEIYAA